MKRANCDDCDKGSYGVIGLLGCMLYGLAMGLLLGGIVVAKIGPALVAAGW